MSRPTYRSMTPEEREAEHAKTQARERREFALAVTIYVLSCIALATLFCGLPAYLIIYALDTLRMIAGTP